MRDNSSGLSGILGLAGIVALFLLARRFLPTLATVMLWIAGIAAVLLIVLIGLVYAVVYYFVFYFMITKFNFKTPGREADDEETKLYTRKDRPARMQ